MNLDYDTLAALKKQHPTLRLLNADNLPLIIAFLYRVFVAPNQRSLAESELVSRLSDFLFELRQRYGDNTYPRSAQAYLDDWADPKNGYLRKYYTERSDEAEFDLTPAAEKTIEWLQSLEQREFVGTESRLLLLFELLRDLTEGGETDPQARLAALRRQRDDIDAEISKVEAGESLAYNATQLRERFFQVEDTARKLLGDFRQVEENFRTLDRHTRERIATGDSAKGQVLDAIFGEHDAIWDNDQGKSFRAFWEFLMSPGRQDELQELLQKTFTLEDIRALSTADNALLPRIKLDLLSAAEKVYQTSSALAEQLRRFLDDQTWLENRRVMELIRDVERQALALRDSGGLPPASLREFASVDDIKPGIELVMERALFQPPKKPVIEATKLSLGDTDGAVSLDALLDQTAVDERELRANIRKALAGRAQISLGQLCRQFPPRQGLAELVTYLHIASRDSESGKASIGDDASAGAVEHIELPEGATAAARYVTLPQVIFLR